mgnify:CR=1 FL=1
MKREHLLELIEILRPSLIKPEMYVNPLLRKMNKVLQDAWERKRKDLLALYNDRSLTDMQRGIGLNNASDRYEKAMKKMRPLEDRFEREVRIPMMVNSGILKKSAVAAVAARRR